MTDTLKPNGKGQSQKPNTQFKPSDARASLNQTLATGSNPESATVSVSYINGQIVGFKAGLNLRISNSASQTSAPTNLLTQDTSFNQGVEAGFRSGVLQHATKSSQSGDYIQGQLAGYQAALQPQAPQQVGIETQKLISSLQGGNQQFNAGVQSGFEVVIKSKAKLEPSLGSGTLGDTTKGMGEEHLGAHKSDVANNSGGKPVDDTLEVHQGLQSGSTNGAGTSVESKKVEVGTQTEVGTDAGVGVAADVKAGVSGGTHVGQGGLEQHLNLTESVGQSSIKR